MMPSVPAASFGFSRIRKREVSQEFVKGNGASPRRFTCFPITAIQQIEVRNMSKSCVPFKLCLALLVGTVLLSGTAKAGNPFQLLADHFTAAAYGHGSAYGREAGYGHGASYGRGAAYGHRAVGVGHSSHWRPPTPPRPNCSPIRPPIRPPVRPPVYRPVWPPVYPPPTFCPPYGHRGPKLTPYPSPWGDYRHPPRRY